MTKQNSLQADNILVFCLIGTYKMKKTKLQKEGFNPRAVSDPLFFMDKNVSKYVELSQDVYDKIINKDIRV